MASVAERSEPYTGEFPFLLKTEVSVHAYYAGTPPSVSKNTNAGPAEFLCELELRSRVRRLWTSGISDPATEPMIKITASESCTCSKQTSSGFDGSDTNKFHPPGTNSERRSASWADSRSGRRSLNVELTKIQRYAFDLLHRTIPDKKLWHCAWRPHQRTEQSSTPNWDQRGF